MKDRAWVEQKIATLKQQRDQLMANVHVHAGAIEVLEEVLREEPIVQIDEPPAPIVTTLREAFGTSTTERIYEFPPMHES